MDRSLALTLVTAIGRHGAFAQLVLATAVATTVVATTIYPLSLSAKQAAVALAGDDVGALAFMAAFCSSTYAMYVALGRAIARSRPDFPW